MVVKKDSGGMCSKCAVKICKRINFEIEKVCWRDGSAVELFFQLVFGSQCTHF